MMSKYITSSMDTFLLPNEHDDSLVDAMEEEGYHDEVVILAPFLLLAVGAFLRHTTRSLPLPYTMQLLVIGTIVGILLRVNKWDGALQHSMSTLENMDPHLLLYIFLPPLVFESASSVQWHLFTKAKWYIISLAGPGLMLAAMLTGFVINFLFENSRFGDEVASLCRSDAWSYQAALLLGVIISATDPVAVVALLKELGCKASLATVIEGESLINDGTALVLYTILIKIVEGDTSDTILDYCVIFIKMSLGGVLFGLLFALIVVQWLRGIFNDALSEITITLASAYLCFFIAEYFFHISGVMSVVCLGLYFGNNGKTSISPEVGHFLQEFWEVLAYIGNTLIFVIAGCVIGYRVGIPAYSDLIQMIIVYIACAIIRAGVVGLTYLVFWVYGSSLEKKDQIITIWAGLRGAVGLSLAMMVYSNSKICESIREMVLFHTAGIVVLTVCFNSVTIPSIVRLLALDSVAPSKQLIYEQALTEIEDAGRKQESKIRVDHSFDSAIWNEARKYYFSSNNYEAKNSSSRRDSTPALDEKELRRRVLMITKKNYWKQFKDGVLSNYSVKYLDHHTDIAIDNDCALNEWQTYSKLLKIGSTLDKGTDKLVPNANSSNAEKRRVKLLNFLDSIPVIVSILLLVIASCILPFSLDNRSISFLIIENSMTVIFLVELLVRLYCLKDWVPCAIDPYIALDVVAISLDIMLLSVEDLLGPFSEFSKSLRSLRFLRLFRLLRLARLASRLNQKKIAAFSEEVTLIGADHWFQKYRRRILFLQLKHGYEVATGFKVAREEALIAMRHLKGEGNSLNEIVHGIERDLTQIRSTLLDVQRLYSEIAASITTVIASRTVLNRQRLAIEELHQEGILDIVEYKKIRGAVEFKMKKLTTHPPIIALPQKLDILKQIPWLSGFDTKKLTEISASFKDIVFQRGDLLVEENDLSDDSVFVLARGTVVVIGTFSSTLAPIEIDELGMGTVFGEIAWALKCPRLASIKATSPGLLFSISGDQLRRLCEDSNTLENRLWETCGYRLSSNILAQNTNRSRRVIREIVHDMILYDIEPTKKNVCFQNDGYVILLKGVAIVFDDLRDTKKVIEAPNIISGVATLGNMQYSVEFSTDAKYMCNPVSLASDFDEDQSIDSNKMSNERSMDDLDLQTARSSSKHLMTIDDLILAPEQGGFGRRYSAPLVNRRGISLTRTGSSKVFKRRTTAIDTGSNYSLDIVDDEQEHSDSSSDIKIVQEVV